MHSRSFLITCLLAVALMQMGGAGCGDDNPSSSPDVTPPGRVTDLRVLQRSAMAAWLLWKAPGDDEDSGRASAYDVRRARYLITASNWPATEALSALRAPKRAGQPESLLVNGLVEGVEFHFALRAVDEAGNESRISNPTSIVTDVTPPAPVDSLGVDGASRTAIRLKWKATGDDGRVGVASSYDLRYARSPMTEETWPNATPVPLVPAPLPPGEWEYVLVSGLDSATRYWFALMAVDEKGNASPLSAVVQGQTTG